LFLIVVGIFIRDGSIVYKKTKKAVYSNSCENNITFLGKYDVSTTVGLRGKSRVLPF